MWLARDLEQVDPDTSAMWDGDLWLFLDDEPQRTDESWECKGRKVKLGVYLMPEVRWETSPLKCEIKLL